MEILYETGKTEKYDLVGTSTFLRVGARAPSNRDVKRCAWNLVIIAISQLINLLIVAFLK